MATSEPKDAEKRYLAERRKQAEKFFTTAYGASVRSIRVLEKTGVDVSQLRVGLGIAVGVSVKGAIFNLLRHREFSGLSEKFADEQAAEIGATVVGAPVDSLRKRVSQAWAKQGLNWLQRSGVPDVQPLQPGETYQVDADERPRRPVRRVRDENQPRKTDRGWSKKFDQ